MVTCNPRSSNHKKGGPMVRLFLCPGTEVFIGQNRKIELHLLESNTQKSFIGNRNNLTFAE
jgi:hypothetical protein